MPVFTTPKPISVTIDFPAGNARIVASQRGDTVVDVGPTDQSHNPDVQAAQQCRISYDAGRLVIKVARPRALGLFGKVGSVDVTIELPEGSHVQGAASAGRFHSVGRLGDCSFNCSAGDIQLDQTTSLDATIGAGDIAVDGIVGHAEISTGTGTVRIRDIGGDASVRNSNGSSWIGSVGGHLRVNAANGDISINHAGADVRASTANGDLHVGEIVRGAASLKTARGEINVGIHAGTAAQLDVSTSFGMVYNRMDAVDRPESFDQTVAIHARTSYGDIVVRRA